MDLGGGRLANTLVHTSSTTKHPFSRPTPALFKLFEHMQLVTIVFSAVTKL